MNKKPKKITYGDKRVNTCDSDPYDFMMGYNKCWDDREKWSQKKRRK